MQGSMARRANAPFAAQTNRPSAASAKLSAIFRTAALSYISWMPKAPEASADEGETTGLQDRKDGTVFCDACPGSMARSPLEPG
jgi:hypothetical protein